MRLCRGYILLPAKGPQIASEQGGLGGKKKPGYAPGGPYGGAWGGGRQSSSPAPANSGPMSPQRPHQQPSASRTHSGAPAASSASTNRRSSSESPVWSCLGSPHCVPRYLYGSYSVTPLGMRSSPLGRSVPLSSIPTPSVVFSLQSQIGSLALCSPYLGPAPPRRRGGSSLALPGTYPSRHVLSTIFTPPSVPW